MIYFAAILKPGSRCKSFSMAFAALFCISTATRAAADNPDVFKHVNNALGAADRHGNFSLWEPLQAGLPIGGQAELPLGIMFNSDQRYSANSCLGYGWWFPILESTVSQVDENNIVMHGPGGHPFYLARDAKNPGAFLTKDWQYKGRQTGDKDFEVEDGKGWRLNYRSGRLVRVVSPAGDELRWNYIATRVDSIVSKQRGELLKAQYDPKTSLLRSIELTGVGGKKSKMSLLYNDVPLIVRGVGEFNSIDRLARSLAEVKWEAGSKLVFAIEASDELSRYKLSRRQVDSGEGAPLRSCSWHALDHQLLSDNDSYYQIDKPADKWGHAKIERFFTDGSKAGYCYDPQTGLLEEMARGGARKTTKYILSPGPNFGKIRQRMQLNGEELRFDYDQTGKLLRRSLNGAQGTTLTSYGSDGTRTDAKVGGEVRTTRPLASGVELEFKEGSQVHRLVFKDGRLESYGN